MENSFLRQVAESLKHNGNIDNVNIVFPQRRAIDVFGALLGDKSPRMLTQARLFASAAGLQKASDVEMLFRLYKAYAGTCKARNGEIMSLEEFLPWGEMMLGDFNDVDKSLADASAVFREAENVRNIDDAPFADADTLEALKQYFATFRQAYGAGMRGRYHAMWDMLLPIYEEVNSLGEKTTYEGAVWRSGCAALKATTQNSKYVFVGFNVLSGVERSVMHYLKNAGCADFYWDYTDGFLAADNPAIAAVKANIRELGGFGSQASYDALSPVGLVVSSTQSGEAAFVAKWFDTIAPSEGQFNAIIPMDDGLMGRLRHFLPTSDYSFNVLYPMSLSSTYARVMRQLDTEVVRPGATAHSVMKAIQAGVETIESNTSALERQSLEAAKTATQVVSELLDRYGEFDVSPRVLSVLLKAQYGNAVAEPSEQRSVNAKTRVDVVKLQDTRTIDYDNVLILDCNEGVLPRRPYKPTMLPGVVRAAYGLPMQGEGGNVAAYNFFRLLKRAPRMTAVYVASENGVGGKEASRFVLQILAGEAKRNHTVWKIEGAARAVQREPQSIRKTPEMLKGITRIEPTPLYMFVECPLKFYYNKIAGLKAPMPDAEKMPANLFGTIFHEAMQLYYERKPSSHIEHDTIAHDLSDKTYRYLDNCIGAAFEVVGVADNSVIHGIIRRYMVDVLRYDTRCAPFDILPQYIEKYIYAPFIAQEKYHVDIGGKFDRVHNSCGNTYVLVDYKTGRWKEPVKIPNADIVFEHPDTAKHFNYALQTFVYSNALNYRLEIEGVASVSIRPELYFITGMRDTNFSPQVYVGGQSLEDFAEVATEVRAGIQRLINRVFNIEEPFYPCEDTKACKYCDFRMLCNRK